MLFDSRRGFLLFSLASWAAGRSLASESLPLPESSVARVNDLYVNPRKVLLWESTRKEIREALEESCIIYKVDLVDLSDASEEFRSRILSEGVLWSE